jgi:hypothetical protein
MLRFRVSGKFWNPTKSPMPFCVENELERFMHFPDVMEEKTLRLSGAIFLFARDVVAFARKVAEHGYITTPS